MCARRHYIQLHAEVYSHRIRMGSTPKVPAAKVEMTEMTRLVEVVHPQIHLDPQSTVINYKACNALGSQQPAGNNSIHKPTDLEINGTNLFDLYRVLVLNSLFHTCTLKREQFPVYDGEIYQMDYLKTVEMQLATSFYITFG